MDDAPVTYCITSSPLGKLLAACTQAGICFLALGDTEPELLAALASEYPRSTPATAGSDCCALAKRAARYLENPAGANDAMLAIALDAKGTPFQKRVWQALRGIPPGVPTTYARLAASLGLPGGARAVAHACAKNPVSVLIPCHRVLRGDGSLGGYRWGLERKRALLRLEGPQDL